MSKHIITTVGTSIFINYMSENEKLSSYSTLKKKSYNDYDSYKDKTNQYKKNIMKWVKSKDKDAFIKCSAEIESLMKIKSNYKDDIIVYLIATDTILSPLASEIIKELLDDAFDIKFNSKHDVIKDLQTQRKDNFIHGSTNLISRIDNIAGGYYDNIVFNITGGYKGVIPYLTLLGAVNYCDIVYIYENSEELIKIPALPIKIDDGLFGKYYKQLSSLPVDKYNSVKNKNYELWQTIEDKGLLDIYDNMAGLSAVGKIFFDKYKNDYLTYYCPDDVWEAIQKQEDIYRILETKFYDKFINKDSKFEEKGTHHVYDDGDNPNRIFFFTNNHDIYIYKTFQQKHNQYETYINNVKCDEDFKKSIIEKSKARNILKNKRRS